MPIYDYECLRCGHHFDKLAKFSDPLPTCPRPLEARTPPVEPLYEGLGVSDELLAGEAEHSPTECGGETKRVISKGGSFHLKGGGWYKDGY